MGWMSTRYRRWTNILRMWNRLVKLDDDRLTKHVFINDWYLAQSDSKNWCTNVFHILHCVGLEDDHSVRGINFYQKVLNRITSTFW